MSARGCRFRQQRFRCASVLKCAGRDRASGFRPCSSRPRSRPVRRSSPAAASRVPRCPYPPGSSPLFVPAQGVGRERTSRARPLPKLRGSRALWVPNVARRFRDRDRPTEIWRQILHETKTSPDTAHLIPIENTIVERTVASKSLVAPTELPRKVAWHGATHFSNRCDPRKQPVQQNSSSVTSSGTRNRTDRCLPPVAPDIAGDQ
jgi:hypothetical protein